MLTKVLLAYTFRDGDNLHSIFRLTTGQIIRLLEFYAMIIKLIVVHKFSQLIVEEEKFSVSLMRLKNE